MLKDGVVRGVPDLIKLPLTIPMSPMIQKPKRKPPAPTNDSRIIRARGVPPPTAVFQPQLAHRLVEPTEYSIPGEVISKRKKQVFMEKLAKEEQAKADQKVFKAHPVPTAPPLAIEHVVKVTEPVAFVLETEMRAQMHPAPYQEPQPVFVAHPAPTSAPFVPQPSDKPLTEPAPLALNTDIRADRRREFDSRVAQEMREQEQIDLQLTERQKGAEKIALKELRKKLVHKASNVRRFPLVAIKQSDKELTTPHSPRISKRTSRQNTLDK